MAQIASPDSLQSLPGSFVDSYKQYKSYTDSFATWLAKIGERCGLHLFISEQTIAQSWAPPTPKSTPGLKGKARRLAREADKIDQSSGPGRSKAKLVAKTLQLRDFVPLAKHTAKFAKHPVVLPRSVLQNMERAFVLRYCYASWFNVRAYGPVPLASNEFHLHFIEVCETALKILEPLCNPTRGLGQTKDTTSNDTTSPENVDRGPSLHKYLKALTVETVEGKEDLEALSQHRNHKKVDNSLVERMMFVPENQSQQDEFILGCFCFFQDLQEVRSSLRETWEKTSKGKSR